MVAPHEIGGEKKGSQPPHAPTAEQSREPPRAPTIPECRFNLTHHQKNSSTNKYGLKKCASSVYTSVFHLDLKKNDLGGGIRARGSRCLPERWYQCTKQQVDTIDNVHRFPKKAHPQSTTTFLC